MDADTPSARLAFALDVPSFDEAIGLVERLKPHVTLFKVGLQLFIAAGPRVVEAIQAQGADVFLDLKVHDIPKTMEHAARAAGSLGVQYLTVHALAGPEGLAAAVEGASDHALTLLAVTVLTSHSARSWESIGQQSRPAASVAHLGALAIAAGCGGLVCSPLEVAQVRRDLGAGPCLVTPGIREAGNVGDTQAGAGSPDDQVRIATPSAALAAGANVLVVGRPIRDAADPVSAAAHYAALVGGGHRTGLDGQFRASGVAPSAVSTEPA